jgi:TonB family protein
MASVLYYFRAGRCGRREGKTFVVKKFIEAAAFGVLAFVASASTCVSASDSTLKLQAAWRVSIDADGYVVQMKANDRLIDAVHAEIDPIARRWMFVPGQVDGLPVATETNLSVDFTLVPVGDDRYTVHIDDARTGGAVDSGTESPPKYPRTEMIKVRSGLAVLDVAYGLDGHVTDVKLVDGAPSVADDFVQSASAAVRHWTFSPEVVGGHALAGHVVMPMCFTIVRDYGPRPPKTLPDSAMCDWTPPGAHAPRHDGQALAIAPAVRLRDDVTTHAM